MRLYFLPNSIQSLSTQQPLLLAIFVYVSASATDGSRSINGREGILLGEVMTLEMGGTLRALEQLFPPLDLPLLRWVLMLLLKLPALPLLWIN